MPAVRERIDALRAGGSSVEVIEPSDEFAELSGWGGFLMDVGGTATAFDAGRTQGEAEVDRIRRIWRVESS